MKITAALKVIFGSLKYYIKDTYDLAVLKLKYPECEFYTGAKITNSTFERFNVINRNVIMDSCTVGSHTYIQKQSTIFNTKIGRFCSIASGVSIGPGIHKMDGVSTHPAFYLKNTPLVKTYSQTDSFESGKLTTIGNDVWIGERAIIIDGVVIGNGAIIAAGSVVTKDVGDYCVFGGVPAKFIKNRFDQEVIDRLNQSEWWNRSEEWLEDHHTAFANPEVFLDNLKKI